MNVVNRRRFERFHLDPGFTPVRVRTGAGAMDGHTYDISEGGVQFELDHPVAVGSSVMIEIELPAPLVGSREMVNRVVGAEADIVWADDSEPGPARMAAVFTRFAREADRERLHRALSHWLRLRAA